jgi:hypothetical protein
MPDDDFVFDLAAFETDLQQTLQNGRIAFQGKYKAQLEALSGLSRAEIDSISPGTTDLQTYDQLITVIKEASRVNLAQAALKKQILQLGDIAVKIARKVPSVAGLLV